MPLNHSTYQLSDLKNVSNAGELFQYSNTAVDGALGGMFLIAIFFIALITLSKKHHIVDSAAISSYGAFIISGILFYGGLLNFQYPLAFLTIASISTFGLYIRNKR